MESHYSHLKLDERRKLAKWLEAKMPISEIADRLGRSDPQRTIYAAHGLKEQAQRVSKTRKMMVHKSATKTKTPRQRSRAT